MSELLTPILGDDCPPGVFWKPNETFVTELADWLKGRRVLEVFAGNGFLASLLAKQGSISRRHPSSQAWTHTTWGSITL